MSMMKTGGLYQKLRNYSDSDYYPFHMPGHKRRTDNSFLKDFPNPYSLDITEIEGFDNLHHAEGILRESMEWAASVYGADRTYYLVNGSSCGILSAICGTTHNLDTILMSRNCHKAAYHGVFLNQLKVKYIYPQIIDGFGLQGGLLADEIEDMLKTFVDISAVFVVSPTYDGIVSNIKKISTICHKYGIPLIVDEAHGAHFRYGESFPVSALELGADVVIQSVHKTLPAFTQTALLHVKKGYVDIERLEYYLQIFQSSSPSYLFMAGIERCIRFMESDGKERMREFEKELNKLREGLGGMKTLSLLDRSVIGTKGVYDLDCSKIVISTKETGISGEQLMNLLRDRYHLEMEMCGVDYVTAITTLMDTEEGLERLESALCSIDRELDYRQRMGGTAERKTKTEKKENTVGEEKLINEVQDVGSSMTIFQAWNEKKFRVRIEDSEGMISGEFIYLYPPGIPFVVPGERISKCVVETVLKYKKLGMSVQGLKDSRAEWIDVIK